MQWFVKKQLVSKFFWHLKLICKYFHHRGTTVGLEKQRQPTSGICVFCGACTATSINRASGSYLLFVEKN